MMVDIDKIIVTLICKFFILPRDLDLPTIEVGYGCCAAGRKPTSVTDLSLLSIPDMSTALPGTVIGLPGTVRSTVASREESSSATTAAPGAVSRESDALALALALVLELALGLAPDGGIGYASLCGSDARRGRAGCA